MIDMHQIHTVLHDKFRVKCPGGNTCGGSCVLDVLIDSFIVIFKKGNFRIEREIRHNLVKMVGKQHDFNGGNGTDYELNERSEKIEKESESIRNAQGSNSEQDDTDSVVEDEATVPARENSAKGRIIDVSKSLPKYIAMNKPLKFPEQIDTNIVFPSKKKKNFPPRKVPICTSERPTGTFHFIKTLKAFGRNMYLFKSSQSDIQNKVFEKEFQILEKSFIA
ncbi:hypothetical protein HDU92_005503 [Lobulomyces angularis]|nr:hypothetical protein HDU92_005503 [Lobulomyces angularis]